MKKNDKKLLKITNIDKKNDVKTNKRALQSKISLGLRPRPLPSPLTLCKTPPYFSKSWDSASPRNFPSYALKEG